MVLATSGLITEIDNNIDKNIDKNIGKVIVKSEEKKGDSSPQKKLSQN